MTSYHKLLVGVAIIALIGLFYSGVGREDGKTTGGFGVDESMQSVILPDPGIADLTNLCPQRNFTASSTTGTLGAVHITGAGNGSLMILDATTTNAALRATAATGSLILVHYPFMGTTTNDYGIAFKNGLLVDYTAGAGTTTITYRCGS